MDACRWLTDAQLFGDEYAADPILDQISIHLRRKVFHRIFEPFQNLKAALARKSAKFNGAMLFHIDN